MATKSVESINTRAYDVLIEVLKEARMEKNVGQMRLSIALGRASSFIQKIEDKHRRIDVAEFCEIADELKISPLELMERYVSRRSKLSEAQPNPPDAESM